jgi:hypothetical protein
MMPTLQDETSEAVEKEGFMKVVFTTTVAIAIVTSSIAAQTTAPKPGPEHKRLGYFVGVWNYQGEAKQSPFGPGGKISGTETCDWFAGGFQLVCRTKGTSAKGPMTGQAIVTYDSARKGYTYYAISSQGDNFFLRGNVDGKVWAWADESTIDGKRMKVRVTVTEETPTSNSFKVEASFDGGAMTVIEEGKSTKVKPT